MNDNSKALLSLLVGATVGVAIGYWLATEDKEELVDKLRETADKVRSELNDEIEKGKQFVDELKNKVSDLLGKA